jgi:hypothetical protein
MRVYSKIVINMETGIRIDKECEWTDDYHGPITECKGGGGNSGEVDKAYNAGMLAISKKQQVIADEMFNYFKHGVPYNPYDAEGKLTEQAQTLGFDPEMVSEAELTQQQLDAQSRMIPLEEEEQKRRFGQAKERGGVVSSIYKDALEGVDVEGRVSEHRAGVEQAFAGAQEQAGRHLSRMGIDPSSGRAHAASANIGLEKAKATSLGETQIRRGAESEDFARKTTAAGLPI